MYWISVSLGNCLEEDVLVVTPDGVYMSTKKDNVKMSQMFLPEAVYLQKRHSHTDFSFMGPFKEISMMLHAYLYVV